MQDCSADLQICNLPRLCSDALFRSLGFGRLLVQLGERLVERVFQFVGSCLFLFELLVEVGVGVLQKALGHPQLPYLLVLDDDFNRVLASL